MPAERARSTKDTLRYRSYSTYGGGHYYHKVHHGLMRSPDAHTMARIAELDSAIQKAKEEQGQARQARDAAVAAEEELRVRHEAEMSIAKGAIQAAREQFRAARDKVRRALQGRSFMSGGTR